MLPYPTHAHLPFTQPPCPAHTPTQHFAKLDTCDFDFVSAGPFLTAKGQQVADEWTTTLKECEEDTMQARVCGFCYFWVLCMPMIYVGVGVL